MTCSDITNKHNNNEKENQLAQSEGCTTALHDVSEDLLFCPWKNISSADIKYNTFGQTQRFSCVFVGFYSDWENCVGKLGFLEDG